MDSIDEYPGVSSWKLYVAGKRGFAARWIRRPMIKRLKSFELSQAEQAKLAQDLTSKAKKRVVFKLSPDAWMGCFGVEEKEERQSINKRIVARVRQLEEGYQAERQKKGVRAVGINKLKSQRMDKLYTPQNFGQRMWCICHDVALRVSFIESVKELLKLARKIRERWRTGDFSLPYPLGLFPPRMERLGNPILGVATL